MSNQTINNQIGFCGKIPSKGDFVQNDFDAKFIDTWNEWLQAVIAVSKEQLQDNWLGCYLTSPIWNFSLSEGVCSDAAICGTLIPSIDKTHRHFPFTVAMKHNLTAVQAWKEADWSVELEDIILEVLEDDFNFSNWIEKLKTKSYLPNIDVIQIENIESADQVKKGWVVQGVIAPSLLQLLHQQYQQQFGHYSIWWTMGSELVEPCFIVTDGLPQVSQFVAMMDGQWIQRDWNLSKMNKDI